MSKIRTRSGDLLDLLNPNPEYINIEDIAFALSNICRFTGHCKFYSVAEHSIYVCNWLTDYHLCGLLHDSTEAYLGDVSSPLKALLPEYKKIEENMWHIISKKFELPIIIPEEVHIVDKKVFEFEKVLLSGKYNPMSPKTARKEFLKLYDSIRSNNNARAIT